MTSSARMMSFWSRHRFQFADLATLLNASVLPLPGVRREEIVSIEQLPSLWGELIELVGVPTHAIPGLNDQFGNNIHIL